MKIKKVTRSAEIKTVKALYVDIDMEDPQLLEKELQIVDVKQGEELETLSTLYKNYKFIKCEVVSVKKYILSMPFDDFLAQAEYEEVKEKEN